MTQAEVAVVVGSAVALALGRRGVSVALLEADAEPGLAASGTNSGILHTGFDSIPGELETELALRSADLRDSVLEALGALDATAAGAAALAAVGAGVWPSTTAIADHVPVGERFEPRRDSDWRRGEHAAWRQFVELAAEL